MGEKKSLLGQVVTWVIVGILAILAIRIGLKLLGFLMGLAGMVFGVAMFLLFTVAPLVLLGWLVMKAWKAFTREPAT